MSLPTDRSYSAEHEWVIIEGNTATVGVTDFASSSLGDVVFVELPEVGTEVNAGSTCGEIESTKSVSDLYSPVTGTVTEVNDGAVESPERVNEDPFGAGWLFKVAMDGEPSGLLDAAAYATLVQG